MRRRLDIVILCERFDCKLTREACGTRHAISGQEFVPAGLTGCRNCRVGEKNEERVSDQARRRRAYTAVFKALNNSRFPRHEPRAEEC